MRWLSSVALLLFLNLWCTPQAFAVHDSRLSPLADTQFYAVAAQQYCADLNMATDSSDEPQSPVSACPAISWHALAGTALSANTSRLVTALPRYSQPRAPPVIP